jgi:hypothetical protein
MSTPSLTRAELQKAVDTAAQYQTHLDAAAALKIQRSTFDHRLREAARKGITVSPNIVNVNSPELLHRQIRRLEGDITAMTKRMNEQDDSLHVIKRLIHDCDRIPRPPKWLTHPSAGKNTGVPTLLASDWHGDEVVDARQINGVNAFNRTIWDQRTKLMFSKTIDLLIHHMHKPTYEYFVLDLGGDMLSGNIHEELRETNEAPVSQSMLHLTDLLIGGIDLLLKHFPRIVVNAVPGNHGRWDKKPRAKNRVYETYEWICYQFLAKHYKENPDVVFNISDGADLPYSIYSTRYLLTHGDQFKGGSGIAGALSPLMLGDARKRKRALAIDQPFDYLVMGHWHQLMMVKGIIVNGSLKGADEYSFQSNFDFEIPQQAMWVTHKHWGITAQWPIKLAQPGEKF